MSALSTCSMCMCVRVCMCMCVGGCRSVTVDVCMCVYVCVCGAAAGCKGVTEYVCMCVYVGVVQGARVYCISTMRKCTVLNSIAFSRFPAMPQVSLSKGTVRSHPLPHLIHHHSSATRPGKAPSHLPSPSRGLGRHHYTSPPPAEAWEGTITPPLPQLEAWESRSESVTLHWSMQWMTEPAAKKLLQHCHTLCA